MNCPVCKRDNAFTLSICPSCGAMVNDSVREELITKVTPLFKPIPKPDHLDLRGDSNVQNKLKANLPSADLIPQKNFEMKQPPVFIPENRKENPETMEFDTKHTSPTLVEFQNKNPSIPEWRLQLKNAVRQRANPVAEAVGESASAIGMADSPAMRRRNFTTSGANALKADEVAEAAQSVESVANPKLAAALKRIEKSRKQFLESEKPAQVIFGEPAKSNNSVLYFTAKPNDHLSVSQKPARIETNSANVATLRPNDIKLDTNKLPPLPKLAQISSSFSQSAMVAESVEQKTVFEPLEDEEVIAVVETITENDELVIDEIELQEIDDCAPLSMRFNSGLFDLIIGSFVSILLLVPFMSFGGEWFGLAGILAVVATISIVMFIYLTTAVALYGRTFGMKLFSLEIIDIEGEDYPTIHQAAVSSSVYLISLLCGGIGFLTLLFNDENRAAHDLASQTIVVKEF